MNETTKIVICVVIIVFFLMYGVFATVASEVVSVESVQIESKESLCRPERCEKYTDHCSEYEVLFGRCVTKVRCVFLKENAPDY